MSAPVPSPYTGRIIIRLQPSLLPAIRGAYDAATIAAGNPLPLATLLEAAGYLHLDNLTEFLANRPYVVAPRLLSDESVTLAKQLEDEAAHSLFPPRRSLLLYWVIDARQRFHRSNLTLLISELRQLQDVETAYPERILVPAAGGTPCSNGTQEYLDGSNVGINVNNSQIFGVYDGAGVSFVDLETGWYFSHEDLPASRTMPPQYFGDVFFTDAKHGTKVLGVVLAQHVPPNQGVLGIAPKADFQGCVSYRFGNDVINFVDDAIIAALVRLSPGGVLLLETETADRYPIEVEDDKFDLIRLCVGAKGVTVVEPAGNGERNLDNWVSSSTPQRKLDRAFQNDSGAILVGACHAATSLAGEHDCYVKGGIGSNYGLRVDASAWGEEVYTTEKSPDQYDCFDGTSAASAIIAGAAILVQNMALKTTNAFVSVTTVRDLLSDLSLGTPVLAGRGAAPSVMPDLVKIAGVMSALPDVFIRDSLSDLGSMPNEILSQSPDIIVSSTQVSIATFATAASWTATPASAPITPNADNFLYVRFRTRSAVATPNTRVWLYWTETSTAAPPSAWHLINAVPVVVNARAPVPGDAQGPIEVAEIIWHPLSNQAVPQHPSTHGCLIAVLDAPRDRAPPPLVYVSTSVPPSWDEFIDYLGQNNNVAFRNFDVVSIMSASATAEVEFDVYGFERHASEMAFEISLEMLPPGVTFELDLPRELAVGIRRANRLPAIRWDEDEGVVTMRLHADERYVAVEHVALAPSARHRCTARLRVAEAVAPCECHVLIRQRFQGQPLGGLTIALRPESWKSQRADKRAYGSKGRRD